jgi:hypothetical protein
VRTGTPRNALLAPQRLRTATEDERAAGQGRALSPVAVAVGAPLALLAWLAVPGYGPTSLLPRLLGVIATALLVATAKVVVLRPRQEPAGSATADPALGGIEGWLPHWPGVAGVSAASWWAARVGGAGLLATFGFRSLSNLAPGWAGASSQAALAAGTVAFLAVTCGLARPEHLLRLALGALSLTGLVVTGSGIVALLGGRLRGPAFVPGPVLPPASGSGPALTSSATAVVLLCLALVSISALAPAKVALRRRLTGTSTSGSPSFRPPLGRSRCRRYCLARAFSYLGSQLRGLPPPATSAPRCRSSLAPSVGARPTCQLQA